MNFDQVLYHLRTFHKGTIELHHHFDGEKQQHTQIHKNQHLLGLQNQYNLGF